MLDMLDVFRCKRRMFLHTYFLSFSRITTDFFFFFNNIHSLSSQKNIITRVSIVHSIPIFYFALNMKVFFRWGWISAMQLIISNYLHGANEDWDLGLFFIHPIGIITIMAYIKITDHGVDSKILTWIIFLCKSIIL